MKENLEKITQGTEHVGQSCIFCQQQFRDTDEVVACPRCRSAHHVQCWKEKGGCGKTGCPQTAQAVRGERPAGDGPPPPVSKTAVILGAAAVLAVILAVIFWPKPPDPAMGRTKITVMGEAYFELNEVMSAWQKAIMQQVKTLTLTCSCFPGAMDTKLIVLIAANEAPDVIAVDDRFGLLSGKY